MKNPYVWNRATPELFFGYDRQNLVIDMCNSLTGFDGSPSTSFSLVGGRRMGKTTLLKRIEKRLDNILDEKSSSNWSVIPVYIDGLAFNHPLIPSDLWSFILQKISISIPELTFSLPNSVEFDDFKRLVRHVIKQNELNLRIVILIDEIEKVVNYEWGNSFLGNIRALISNTDDLMNYFTFVISGANEMGQIQNDRTSPLYNVLTPRSLRTLSYEDSCLLMESPISYHWSRDFLKRVYAETGGHPMFLQYIMQQICKAPLENGERGIDQAVKQFEQELGRRLFDDWWEKYCTTTMRELYGQLNSDGSLIGKGQLVEVFKNKYTSFEINDAIITLEYMGLITTERDGFDVRYSSNIFYRWYHNYNLILPSTAPSPSSNDKENRSGSSQWRLIITTLIMLAVIISIISVLTWAAGQVSGLALLLILVVGLVLVLVSLIFILVINNQITSKQAVAIYTRVIDLIPPLGRFLDKEID